MTTTPAEATAAATAQDAGVARRGSQWQLRLLGAFNARNGDVRITRLALAHALPPGRAPPDAELPYLHQALRSAVADGAPTEALELALALQPHWQRRGIAPDLLALLDAAATAVPDSAPPLSPACTLLAQMQLDAGAVARAHVLAARALARAAARLPTVPPPCASRCAWWPKATDVQTGTLAFASGSTTFNAGTSFTGAGVALVSNNASFNGGFTASNLTLSGGQFSGGNAVLNGVVGWTGGTLAGSWQVATGQTLNLQASAANKLLNGTLVNNGSIAVTDTLSLQNGNVLTNNTLFDVQTDTGLADGSGSGSFVNNGSFRKSGGTGSTLVAGVTFTNSGVIDARSGSIVFNGGAANFNAGTQFTGAGQNVVSNNANFSGSFTASNLQLTGGQFTGNAAVLNGTVGWSGGTLAGGWQVAAGQTLNVQASTAGKLLNGSLTNSGSVAASDSIGLQTGNVLVNNGRYDLQGNVGFYDGGGNGSVVNNGLLIKTAGSGVSNLSGINFVNNGVADVTGGSIQLPASFSNPGTLTGAGSFSTNQLTNGGHVAPGDGVGRLTIGGNVVQTAAGSFDVDLTSLASHDLLAVTGTATLGGTLAVQCFAACSFAVGDLIDVLDYSGSRSGTFASLTLSGFATGAFTAIYDDANSRVLLQVTQAVTAAVPEPGSWALLLVGLAALAGRARQRRA